MALAELELQEFYAAPPVFKAVQWDGTDEGAQLVFRAIKLHSHRISAQTVSYVDEKGISRRLEIEYGHDSKERMVEGDWAVLHPGSTTVQFLPDHRFKQLYFPKEA